MDMFGTEALARGAVRVAFNAARSTGRTTHLVDNLRNGDVVVCLSSRSADRLKQLARDKGLKIRVSVVSMTDPLPYLKGFRAQERLIFDHEWLEAFYEDALARAAEFVTSAERELSSREAQQPKENPRVSFEKQRWDITP